VTGPRRAAVLAALVAAGAAPPPAPPPVRLPVGYRLSLPERVEVEAGQGSAASLTIAPEPGYAVSRSGPLRVDLSAAPADGLELPRRRYGRAHAADPRADAPRFDLAVRGARPGRYRLDVGVRFWLCRGPSCRPIRASRAVAVEVRPAAGRPQR
jgi:hypothetical protein